MANSLGLRPTNSVLSLCLFLLAACSPGTNVATVSVSDAFTMHALYGELAAMTSGQREATARFAAKLPIMNYYQAMLQNTSNASFAVNGLTFANARDAVVASAPFYRALAAKFSSLGSYWQAVGFTPQLAMSETQFTTLLGSQLAQAAHASPPTASNLGLLGNIVSCFQQDTCPAPEDEASSSDDDASSIGSCDEEPNPEDPPPVPPDHMPTGSDAARPYVEVVNNLNAELESARARQAPTYWSDVTARQRTYGVSGLSHNPLTGTSAPGVTYAITRDVNTALETNGYRLDITNALTGVITYYYLVRAGWISGGYDCGKAKGY